MRFKLAIGACMLTLLVFVAVFPSLFAPFPQGYSDSLRVIEGKDGEEWRFAPEAPSAYYPFGSDIYGYDIATMLAWGLRWTLACVFVVSLARTIAGGAIGMIKAIAGGRDGKRRFMSPLNAIPSFVFVFFLIYPVTINSPLSSVQLFFFQCAVMTIFDLGGIISTVSLKTSALLDKEFVQAATACGAGKRWISRYHILPLLAEDILEIFATQTVAVLQLVGRLGMFSMFIGGTVMTFEPIILRSKTGEIAGLVGLYRGRLMSARWLILYPLGAYLVVLASLRTFVSGLHDRLKRRASVVL